MAHTNTRIRWLALLLLASGWLFSPFVTADLPPLVINDNDNTPVQGFIEFTSHTDQLSRELLVQGQYDDQFQRYDDPRAMRSNKGIWLRLKITNSSSTADLVISMADILYNEVELLYYQNGRLHQEFLGIRHPYVYRKTGYHDIAFFVQQPVDSTQTYFIRFVTDYPFLLDGFVTTDQTYAKHQNNRNAIGFLLVGSTLGVILYLSMITRYLRNVRETWHCLAFVISSLAVLLFGRGLIFTAVPDNTWINSHLYSSIFIILTITFVAFSRHHFDTERDFPLLHKAFIGIETIAFLMLIASLFMPVHWSAMAIQAMAFALTFFMCLTSVYIWSNSQRRLALYVIGTLAFLFTSILTAAENNGLINMGGQMVIAFETGLCLQAALFAMATTQKVKEGQKQKMDHVIAAAEQSAEAKANGGLLAKMSQELRTPLSNLLGMLDLLDDTELNNQQKHYTNVMQNSGLLLLSVIDDVLDYSRIVSGNFPLQHANYDMQELADEIAAMFSESAKTKRLSFSLNLNGTGPFLVHGDRLRLRQILINLIGNAIKFTQKGHVTARLALEQHTDKDWRISAEIEDTGCGISTENLSGIFREQQGNSASIQSHGSSGLGLVICHKLVSMMGGKLDVESAPGYGSLFRFHILVSPPTQDDANTRTPSDQEPTAHSNMHSQP